MGECALRHPVVGQSVCICWPLFPPVWSAIQFARVQGQAGQFQSAGGSTEPLGDQHSPPLGAGQAPSGDFLYSGSRLMRTRFQTSSIQAAAAAQPKQMRLGVAWLANAYKPN